MPDNADMRFLPGRHPAGLAFAKMVVRFFAKN